MNNNLECANYFKSRPEYRRCFGELRKKWKSYGRAAGRVTLADASERECRAVGGIVGRAYDVGTIQFSVAEFEAGLQRTRFAPVKLGEVLAHYFGEELSTNQEQKRREQEKRTEFFEGLIDFFERQAGGTCKDCRARSLGFYDASDFSEQISVPEREDIYGGGKRSSAAKWLNLAVETKKYGYYLLAKEHARSAPDAEQLVKAVGRALDLMISEEMNGIGQPLAVFAAKISGNPHYFDRGTTAGQLLVHAICCFRNRELPKNAHEWRELLLHAGITPDNVSSSVHAYGLRLRTADGYHPAYEAFCARKEPFVITLENLRGVIGADVVGNCAYVVENEMVFSYLTECVREKAVTLLCTSGQPRTAAMELFSLLAASHVEIYYSGDIDPEGIDIADRLWRRYGDAVRIWRMGPSDYEKSISAEAVDEVRLAKLDHVGHPLLKETARYVREQSCAGYQENLLEELVGDVRGANICAQQGFSTTP